MVRVAQSERKWNVYSQSDPVVEISQIELLQSMVVHIFWSNVVVPALVS